LARVAESQGAGRDAARPTLADFGFDLVASVFTLGRESVVRAAQQAYVFDL
jgi:hypothetical protein